ncbi:hypothetical protein EJB05_45812, partial [Eragrostis curvula]
MSGAVRILSNVALGAAAAVVALMAMAALYTTACWGRGTIKVHRGDALKLQFAIINITDFSYIIIQMNLFMCNRGIDPVLLLLITYDYRCKVRGNDTLRLCMAMVIKTCLWISCYLWYQTCIRMRLVMLILSETIQSSI